MSSLVCDVSVRDTAIVGIATALLLMVVLAACIFPRLPAAWPDQIVALRPA